MLWAGNRTQHNVLGWELNPTLAELHLTIWSQPVEILSEPSRLPLRVQRPVRLGPTAPRATIARRRLQGGGNEARMVQGSFKKRHGVFPAGAVCRGRGGIPGWPKRRPDLRVPSGRSGSYDVSLCLQGSYYPSQTSLLSPSNETVYFRHSCPHVS